MTKLTSQLRSFFRPLIGRPRNSQTFEELFKRFREVLDRNNRSLEIITEMGDTLSGDYLFDVKYVKHSYGRLSNAVHESLTAFDVLTQDGYPKLRSVFLNIDGQIMRVIDDTSSASGELVLLYENITGNMVKTVGGKNSNLAEIRNRTAVNVPDAFAVTTRSFDVFLEHNRFFDKITFPSDASPVSSAALHEAHELIIQGTMPPDLSRAIDRAVSKIRSRHGADCSIAVRSSAGEEDGDFSFAGQFETILNVPLETPAVEKAYRKVIASLYSEKAALYQARIGYVPRDMKMAVACVVMVDADVSGVLYSSDPRGDRSAIVINATWGLGSSVVEGQTDADYFKVKKDPFGGFIENRIGAKDSMIASLKGGGLALIETPEDKKCLPSLSPEQTADLVRIGILLERHFQRPQDIEWAIDRQGKIFILQSRPLRLPEDAVCTTVPAATPPGARIVMKHSGLIVRKGAAVGPVFIVRNEQDLNEVPRGAILVARHDSSNFIRVMTEVAAIITDSGSLMSHMAALCREFRLPTIVDMGDATKILVHGEVVTVRADGTGADLYRGERKELLNCAQAEAASMETLSEFRKKRYILRYISPLNLIDPLRDEFTPEACRTVHDILRFIHEKSVVELIENAGYGVQACASIKLDLAVPAGIMLIDIGGGLQGPVQGQHAAPEQISSLPMCAIVSGMTLPGLWRSDAVPLKVNDFMTSMLRAPSIDADSANHVAPNVAVISKEYVNLSLRFGYHFIVLDCFCGEYARNNHIYFRFTGGATDMTKRSRRLRFIDAVLGEHGFAIKTKGDLLVARLSNIRQEDAVAVLDLLGRLLSFTRQLDALLNDDGAVDRFSKKFLSCDYSL